MRNTRELNEIEKKRADNLNILIEKENLKNIDLVKCLNEAFKDDNKSKRGEIKDPSQISKYRNKKEPISDKTAKIIHKAFPSYSLDWLLGYSKYMNENEETMEEINKRNKEFNVILDKKSRETYLMFNAICSLAALDGYDVKIKDIESEYAKINKTGNETFEECFNDYMVFYRNGKKEFSLSLEDADHLGNNLSDIFMSNIKWYFKERKLDKTTS